jgi:hypothetical protein
MKAFFVAIAAMLWIGAAQASQVTILSIESSWSSATVIDNRAGGVENAGLSGVGTNQLNWGDPYKGGTEQSGFLFEHETNIVDSKHDANSLFNVGTFTHINRVIHCDEHLDVARLNMRVTASFDGVTKTFDTSYLFSLLETPNNDDPCVGGSGTENQNGCADRVMLLENDAVTESFEHNGLTYSFELFGFDGGSEFWTIEDRENHAWLKARFSVTSLTSVTPVPLPAGTWLLLGGLAALVSLRRRARG